MKKWLILFALFLTMAGCGNPQSILPDETQMQIQTLPVIPDSSDSKPKFEGNVQDTIGHGWPDEFLSSLPQDELDHYLVYDGTELSISLMLKLPLEVQKLGYRIYFFLDGKPQPYSIEPGGTCEYFHTIYEPMQLKPSSGSIKSFYFTPITGAKGETLELTYMLQMDPDYALNYPSNEEITVYNAFPFAQGFSKRIYFESTPSEQSTPQVKDRIISCKTGYQDLTSQETAGWSSEDYSTEIQTYFTVDQFDSEGISFEITPDHPVPIHFEVMGAPTAQFSLVIFLDGELVSVASEDEVLLQPQNGQKATADVLIDFSDFDGESQIFMFLVPRNYISAQLGPSCIIQYYKEYWFVDDPMPLHYHRSDSQT